jgi:hypothetical protein
MRELRKYLSWLFAFTSLVCLQISFSLTPNMLRQHPHADQLSLTSQILLPVLPWIFPLFAIVFGMAWWTSFKAKSSARIWGIIASLINVQTALLPLLIPPHSFFNAFLLILGVGIAGLVAFARPYESSAQPVKAYEIPAMPGDGTSNLLNKAMPLLILIAGGSAFSWWLRWIRKEDIFIARSNSNLILVSVLLTAIIVTLHEFGHTVVGLILGMKLQAFIVGPFQWCIRDGKWKFQFQPSQILMGGGATGIVPAVVDFPRWAYVCMLLGGILVNTGTGIATLCLAFGSHPDSSAEAGGFVALFGAWSLMVAAVNLIPFRTPNNYSDGAQIYQLLANNVWADFHRAVAIAGTSLVTSVRPRDYDIQTIARASRGITQGPHGLILHLLAYSHFFDKGDFATAGEELEQAALIYNKSASNVTGELLTIFVFGTAYIWRNAQSTRAWWTQMEAKKPVRVNVDYWLAASALHWVEGAILDARASLEKANRLALQLPEAGAYDFQRYSCTLLRHALDVTDV